VPGRARPCTRNGVVHAYCPVVSTIRKRASPRAEAAGEVFLVPTARDRDRIKTHARRKLHAEMAEPANT
jgi:hypothetical protein